MPDEDTRVDEGALFYGWVIVAACTVMFAVMAGIIYSYGIFFKPLISDFGWNRADTSGVYSLFTIFQGSFGIASGWLADRFGPSKVMALCSFIAGLGLILTSQVNAIWQLYLTYGVIVGIGLSATFPTSTATTARWFIKRRGLALGIVAGGLGLGTLLFVPLAERLVTAFGWSTSYLVIGVVSWAVMIPSSLLLRRSPEEKLSKPQRIDKSKQPSSMGDSEVTNRDSSEIAALIKTAARHKPLWMLAFTYFLFNFCLQMIMLHLVNYATDLGIASLVAASFISMAGMCSVLGRIVMGTASDRIGCNNALLICCVILSTTVALLNFSREVWMLYLFSIIFGFAYGGEVPQMPALIGRYFGLQAAAVLLGIVGACAGIGGALGSWLGGRVFDVTQTYQVAFIVALIASLFPIATTLLLKRMKPVISG